MLILGIESSCDETAASVVQDGRRVLSNIVASQAALHEEYAGVVPEIASRAHVERILPVVREALAQAGAGLGMIDAVAVGHRPGLIGSLLVGVTAAKALAWSLGKPLIGVDHVHAHLYSGVLRGQEDLGDVPFPALGLVVSGGHTSLYRLESWTRLVRLGATIDDALGEAFDKAATLLGLPYPGGPNLDRLAEQDGADDRMTELPISRIAPGSLDFSFSGLKTAMLYAVRGVPGPKGRAAPPLTEARRRDLAASFRRAAVRAVMLKLERAAEVHAYRGVCTGGGVTANALLRRELNAFGASRAVPVFLPRLEFCMDNAAMIAGLGSELIRDCGASDLSLRADPSSIV
ncbi:MAG: tRNA (adenosine(37)-N6)-threonylcarbamoyltransferase complex transferase subunit TsaD [Phycisphaerae bacterium]|nr:tRNA (adenosine(37)-N6)-threonylcarbamoyltransferase complex transferase subunit TsaD [Phycisphaerae bacterium]